MALTMTSPQLPTFGFGAKQAANAFASHANAFGGGNLGGGMPGMLNSGGHDLQLPTPEGFEGWEHVLGSFGAANEAEGEDEGDAVGMELAQDIGNLDLDDDELIEMPRVSPPSTPTLTSAAAFTAGPAFDFDDFLGAKPDPGATGQALVPAAGIFGGMMPTSPALASPQLPVFAASSADIAAAGAAGLHMPAAVLDFAASLDHIPRRLDKDVAPNALVPYAPAAAAGTPNPNPNPPPHALAAAAAVPALKASQAQWQQQRRRQTQAPTPKRQQLQALAVPGRIEDLSEHQLATIERKALVKMMDASKYTDAQKADVRKRRRLYKNRISAKGAIVKKKTAQRSLTMVNTHLVQSVEELQRQNTDLRRTNQRLEHNVSAAQQVAHAHAQERAEYQQKIAELTAMLQRLDPAAAV